jgi:hypothetical protein
LYFEIDTIPCRYDVIDPETDYGLNWMQNDVGYDSKEMNQIAGCRDRIFEKIESKILDVEIEDDEDEERSRIVARKFIRFSIRNKCYCT